jgi:hypothetical protein
MSSNNPQQPSKNYQYASTTPSVSSLLNLPQVQDKKKPVAGLAGVSGLASHSTVSGADSRSGLAGKPAGALRTNAALGLAPAKQSLGTLKLKKTEPSSNTAYIPKITETALSSASEVKAPSVTETKAPSLNGTENKMNIKTTSKVEKAKTEKNKSAKQVPTASQNPSDHFDPSHWRLFVGNLGPEVSDSLLLNTFKNSYTSTSKVIIVRDWKTQKSKGYAFVAFSDGKEFLKALKEMNGKWIGNRQCIIKKSEHQPKF